MLLKCYTQYVCKFGKLSSGHRTGKGQFSLQFQRRAMPKNVQITIQLHSFHMLAKVMLKIFQARLQLYMYQELSDVQAGFKKGRGTRDQIANIHWLIETARTFQKTICFIDYNNPLTVWITTNCGKFLKSWKYQTTLPASGETCMHVRKQQLELDMEQQTGSKQERSTSRLYIVILLIYMQSTSFEMKCRAG